MWSVVSPNWPHTVCKLFWQEPKQSLKRTAAQQLLFPVAVAVRQRGQQKTPAFVWKHAPWLCQLCERCSSPAADALQSSVLACVIRKQHVLVMAVDSWRGVIIGRRKNKPYVYKTNVLSNDVQWFYTRNSSEKKKYFNGCPVRNLVASSTLESGFASKYWQASLQSSRLLSIAAVPDGNLDGFWEATMDPLSTLSWVLGVTRKRTSWQMSVTDWCKTFTRQLLPGLAFRLPGRRPCCCGPVLCRSDPKAACNCFVTAAAFLSGTVSPELGKQTPCKSVCAFTENTIYMLAASCSKHPPKLQTQHQHDL